MTGPVRVEVTDEHGTVGLILDPPALDARQRKALDRAMARMVGHLWAVLGTSEEHAREVAICTLTRLVADEEAYDRVAASKQAAQQEAAELTLF
jgi:hypothetical protein